MYFSLESYVTLGAQLTAAKTVQILLMLNPESLEGFSTQRGLSYKLIYEKELIDKIENCTKNILNTPANCGTSQDYILTRVNPLTYAGHLGYYFKISLE